MRIKTLLSISALSLALASNSAHAFFFFFIPGSVTGKIEDAFTGAEGANCVGTQAKVGDTIRLPSGALMSVKSLSGTSSRCNRSDLPIRALLVPVDMAAAAGFQGINLPDGWESVNISPSLQGRGIFFFAKNQANAAKLAISAMDHTNVPDVMAYVKTRVSSQASKLKDAQAGDVEQLTIKGMPAWRFDVSGKDSLGQDYTYQTTIIEVETKIKGSQLIYINVWVPTQGYAAYKPVLSSLAGGLIGTDETPGAETK